MSADDLPIMFQKIMEYVKDQEIGESDGPDAKRTVVSKIIKRNATA